MDKVCHLILAGEECLDGFAYNNGDLIIAVDGGVKPLLRRFVSPDIVIGDFDSLGYVPTDGEIIRLNPEKDETDTFAAIKEGIKRGYRKFILYCALGGRLSHTLGNIAALEYIRKSGAFGKLVGKNTTVVLCDTAYSPSPCKFVSLLPLSPAADVKLINFKYSGNIHLTSDSSIGISNEPENNANIKVISGVVIVICEGN